ncbi:hypothetical protein ACHQM5_024957 [Ranunculus cassubicifolius]
MFFGNGSGMIAYHQDRPPANQQYQQRINPFRRRLRKSDAIVICKTFYEEGIISASKKRELAGLSFFFLFNFSHA